MACGVIAEGSRSGCENGGVEKDGDEVIIIFPVHNSRVKLTQLDERVKNLDGMRWPR